MTETLSVRNFLAILLVASTLANLVLGSLVLIDSPRRKVNRIFSILCFNLSIWGVAFLGVTFSESGTAIRVWSRFYAASLVFVPPLFYHLILGSLGTPFKDQGPSQHALAHRIKLLAYVFSAGWILFMAGGIFPGQDPHTSAFDTGVGQQFWIAIVAYILVSGVGLTLLFRNIKRSVDFNQKNRLLYLGAGSGLVLLSGLFNFLMVHAALGQTHWAISLCHLSSTIALMILAYALTTSQMYQFAELFRKTVAFLVMTSILLTVFGGTHFASNILFVPYIPNSDFFALAVASILMALVFHPLRFRVQNLVDRLFFYKRFDQMQRLRALARKVLSSADREELLNTLFTSLTEMGFGSVTLLLKDPQKPIFHLKKSKGLAETAEGFFLRSDSLLVQYLREEKEELIRDEVLRRIMTDWERQALGDEMSILEAEISFPLFSTRRRALFGIITLGNSELGNSSFKGRNIFWLKSVIDNAGIMLDNFYHHEFANALIPYVGRTWADQMRRNKEGFRERLEGSRVWVSVLMVDIRHFTSMSSRMDPKDVVSMLKDFRLRIAPVVYRHQGTIDKFIGDAIMIVFGLPILPPLDNPDKNAVECAISIQKEIEKMNIERVRSRTGERIAIGIGVSSGEVIAGNVDSGDRVEYTVIGDAANMVARLEDLAGENQILLSPGTFDRVKGQFNLKAWEPREITGFSEPLIVYELLTDGEPSSSYKGLTRQAIDEIAANQ